MALETRLGNLCSRLEALREALAGLRVTAVEDRPLQGESILAESLGELAEDLLGEAGEALGHAQEALLAAGPPLDDGRMLAALSECQERVLPLLERYFSNLVRYECLAELARLGRERSGEWRAWAGTVHQGAEACRQPLHDTCESLAAGWRELADQLPKRALARR
jgi:hypothetical protein